MLRWELESRFGWGAGVRFEAGDFAAFACGLSLALEFALDCSRELEFCLGCDESVCFGLALSIFFRPRLEDVLSFLIERLTVGATGCSASFWPSLCSNAEARGRFNGMLRGTDRDGAVFNESDSA